MGYWSKKSRDKCEKRRRSFSQLSSLLLLVGVFPLLLFTYKWLRPRTSPPPAMPAPLPSMARSNEELRISGELWSRPLLPYSVIPGGVANAQELRTALMNDPVVARHYSGFDLAETRLAHLDRDEAVYVSYRLGGQIYWTSRRLTLLKGEAILTDGEHQARMRCGNRISATPEKPVSPRQPELAGYVPDLADGPLPDLVPPANTATPEIVELSPFGATQSPTGWFFIPPFVPTSGTPGTPLTPGTPGSPPLVPTPEPGTLFLLISGISVLAYARKKLTR
jgi:hypothetical protein